MFSTIRVLVLAALAVTIPTALLAQRTLTGTVLDAQGAAVPFAVVVLPGHQRGVQANQAGTFSLDLPTNLVSTDSLSVSALGYRARRVPVPATPACTLRLAALPVALTEVVVHAATIPPQWLGPEQDTQRFGFGQNGLSADKNTGWQIARYFQPSAAGFLTGARFYVKESGFETCGEHLRQAPFRVRVYAADGPNGSPGTDLLTTTVLATATKKAGWVAVDLRQYNIALPVQGAFVAMEWVYTSDEFMCRYRYTQQPTGEKKEGTRYGQVLGGRLALETSTWYYTVGRGWLKFQSRDPSGQQRVGDAAIQAQYVP